MPCPSQQMDVICSSKLSERSGSSETYQKLAELLSFAVQCQQSAAEGQPQ